MTGLIQFETRKNAGRYVRYRTAVFGYDRVAIYADELLFDRKALRLTASGTSVILEDGKQRIEVKGVAASFSKDEPLVEVIRE